MYRTAELSRGNHIRKTANTRTHQRAFAPHSEGKHLHATKTTSITFFPQRRKQLFNTSALYMNATWSGLVRLNRFVDLTRTEELLGLSQKAVGEHQPGAFRLGRPTQQGVCKCGLVESDKTWHHFSNPRVYPLG